MNTALATNIREKLQERGITTYSLEKEAGLKPKAVRNILLGHSNNPSAAVLMSIAKVLNCSIDELLGEEEEHNGSTDSTQDIKIQNMKLFNETTNEVMSLFETYGRQPTGKEFIFLIREIYIYSLERNSGALDKKFADWLYTRNFS